MKLTSEVTRREMTAAAFCCRSDRDCTPRRAGRPRPEAAEREAQHRWRGAQGHGAGDIQNRASESIVALCHIDQGVLNHLATQYPKAKLHTDFRKMLETQKDIDAVVTMTAHKMGKHIHCQKPLTHSV